MKKINLLFILIVFAVSIGNGQSFIGITGNYGQTDTDFESTYGFGIGYSFPIGNRLIINPFSKLQKLVFDKTITTNGATLSLNATDVYYTFGTGVYYKLFVRDKMYLAAGPKLDISFFPVQENIFDRNLVVSPKEVRFNGGLQVNFVDRVSSVIGFEVGLEYGYMTESKLVEGKDYQNSYSGRTYEAFSAYGIRLGLLVFID